MIRIGKTLRTLKPPPGSLDQVVVPTRRLRAGMIKVWLGKVAKMTRLYKKKNGSFVYWSPWTGERIEIRKTPKQLWCEPRIRALEERLQNQRGCPERPSRHNAQITDSGGAGGGKENRS